MCSPPRLNDLRDLGVEGTHPNSVWHVLMTGEWRRKAARAFGKGYRADFVVRGSASLAFLLSIAVPRGRGNFLEIIYIVA
jgi:hypothetical protein